MDLLCGWKLMVAIYVVGIAVAAIAAWELLGWAFRAVFG